MADSREDLLIAPMTFVQLEPLLRELQDSIMAADYNKFRDLIAVCHHYPCVISCAGLLLL